MRENNMDTSAWKWFTYDQIFDIRKGKRLTKADMEDGEIPYIGAIDSNNGVSAFISNNIHLHKGNTISVSYNGSVGYAFYQERPFWATDDVNVLYAKNFTLNRYIALFLCTLIEKERFRFSYGRKWQKELMQNSRIKLPVTSTGIPDWHGIEDNIRTRIIPLLPYKAQVIYSESYDDAPYNTNVLKFNTQKWVWFNVAELFHTIEKCKCSNATELLNDGDEIAYIGAKKKENGVMRYVKYDADLVTKGNCIVFIGDGQGSVGYCLYQPNDFIGSTTLIAGYNDHLNVYTALFLVSVLDLERYRYSFGRKYNKNAILNSRIKLPVDANGNPDWQFMEDYIKSLPYSKNIE